MTRKVLTMSLHKAGPLYFPGTGGVADTDGSAAGCQLSGALHELAVRL